MSSLLQSINLLFTLCRVMCHSAHCQAWWDLSLEYRRLTKTFPMILFFSSQPFWSSFTCLHHLHQSSTIYLLLRHVISGQLIKAIVKINLIAWFDFNGTQGGGVCLGIWFGLQTAINTKCPVVLENLYTDRVELIG